MGNTVLERASARARLWENAAQSPVIAKKRDCPPRSSVGQARRAHRTLPRRARCNSHDGIATTRPLRWVIAAEVIAAERNGRSLRRERMVRIFRSARFCTGLLLALGACSSDPSNANGGAGATSIAGSSASSGASGAAMAGVGGVSGAPLGGAAGTPAAGASSLAGQSNAGGPPSSGAGGGAGASSAGAASGGAAGSGASSAAGSAGKGGAGGGAGSAGAAGAAGANGYSPCPTTAATPCSVLPLGDSITEGFGSSGGGYRVELFRQAVQNGKQLTFVGSLQNGPASVENKTFPKQHEGHGGFTIDSGTGHSGISGSITDQAISNYHPNIVLLMIGTNDINGNIDISHAPDRLGNLIDDITTRAPQSLVVVATIIPIANDGTNQKVKTYNSALPALVNARATAGKHVVLLDNYAAFSKDASYATTLMYDYLHPNDAGYAVLGRAFFNAIQQVFPKTP